MLNYEVKPILLAPLVPLGVELDHFDGACYVSVVGFLFLRTRICGVGVPFHRDFEEVNLRFYVRQRGPDGWRRGVVFVKELVPRRAIALLARTIYGEPYESVPMAHQITTTNGLTSLRYEWQRHQQTEFVSGAVAGEPAFVSPGSLEQFITEHYWGYNAVRGRSLQYQIEHPSWRVWPATDARFQANVSTLYGSGFVEPLAAAPASAFVAEGSEVVVRRGHVIPHRD